LEAPLAAAGGEAGFDALAAGDRDFFYFLTLFNPNFNP
jgi:hypothetical protein